MQLLENVFRKVLRNEKFSRIHMKTSASEPIFSKAVDVVSRNNILRHYYILVYV